MKVKEKYAKEKNNFHVNQSSKNDSFILLLPIAATLKQVPLWRALSTWPIPIVIINGTCVKNAHITPYAYKMEIIYLVKLNQIIKQ